MYVLSSRSSQLTRTMALRIEEDSGRDLRACSVKWQGHGREAQVAKGFSPDSRQACRKRIRGSRAVCSAVPGESFHWGKCRDAAEICERYPERGRGSQKCCLRILP